MALYLGIDGGGSGCRAAVADASGAVLGLGQSGPANIATDPDSARGNILAAARQALVSAIGQSRVETEFPRLRAGLGLAGANAAGAAGRIRLALPFDRIRIENDAIAAVKGALCGRDGIVAAIGTGSVFARQVDGVIDQIGGWGFALGDEGGGAALGRAVLSRALRAKDGFLAMTPLLAEILADFGGPEGVVAFAQTARPTDFATLAPRLLASIDPAAFAVLASGGQEISSAISLLQAGGSLPVTFIGGLGSHYASQLEGVWQIAQPLGSALDGALMLAQEAA